MLLFLVAQAVEQRAMEKVNFKEIEEEAKAKSKLMEFIENSDNVESSSADNQLAKEAINQPANAKLLTGIIFLTNQYGAILLC